MSTNWTCTTCGKTYSLREGVAFDHRCLGPRVAIASQSFPETRAPSPQQTGPGFVLTRLLAELGFVYTPECNCRSVAAAMDAGGAEWCRLNADWIVTEILAEARRRGLVGEDNRMAAAFDKTARWLVSLAITLVEEERALSFSERVRLRALRFAAQTRLTRAILGDNDTSLERYSHA